MGKLIDSTEFEMEISRRMGCYTTCEHFGEDIHNIIESIPERTKKADKGIWLSVNLFWNIVQCSKCGGQTIYKTAYCPHCGVEMKK